MNAVNENYFTFVILTYNHENFILEHLESIRHQIESYGDNWNFNIVIADDNSKDGTIKIVNSWLNVNSKLFIGVVVLENSINKGTCTNYINTWKEINTLYFKVLAGDDLYTYENIIDFSKKTNKYHFISGVPLLLEDQNLSIPKSLILNMIATSEMYKKNIGIAMRSFSAINTPSLVYPKKILALNGLSEFINQFDVVEDFPMQIKVCELCEPAEYFLSDKVYVYYRRTTNSTYIIVNDRFLKDKTKQFEYLISKQKSLFKKILLKNRIKCLHIKNPVLRFIFNLNTYIYFFKFFLHIPKILLKYKKNQINLEAHRKYYNEILDNVEAFKTKYI